MGTTRTTPVTTAPTNSGEKRSTGASTARHRVLSNPVRRGGNVNVDHLIDVRMDCGVAPRRGAAVRSRHSRATVLQRIPGETTRLGEAVEVASRYVLDDGT